MKHTEIDKMRLYGVAKSGNQQSGRVCCARICVGVCVYAWPIEFQSPRQKFVRQAQLALTFETSELLIARPDLRDLDL